MSNTRERLAVTGVGIVSALGPDSATSMSRLMAGERGFGPVTLFDVEGQHSRIAAEIRDLRVHDIAPRGEADAWSRTDAMAVVAAREALQMAGLEPGTSGLGLAVGGTTGGMLEAEAVLADLPPVDAPGDAVRRLLSYPLSTSAERVSRTLGPVDRAVSLCSACSSGAIAIAQGAAWLHRRVCDRVLVGGTDGLCRLTFTGFNSLGAVDPEPCRPFDVSRAGLGLGEAAGFLLLEPAHLAEARGATVLAWFDACAILAEAHHITHPEPSGVIPEKLLSMALEHAGLGVEQLDYVNAHGTGTQQNDAMEARALARLLGDHRARVRVSSSKAQFGHTLGASGAIEAAITVLALHRGEVPPTAGLEQPDPEPGLRHVMGRGVRAPLRAALSSSFGFGGTGAVLAFSNAGEPDRRRDRPMHPRLFITGSASVGPLGLVEGEGNADYAPATPGGSPVPSRLDLDPLALLDGGRSRRFDRAAAMLCAGAERALASAELEASGGGLVAGTAFGNVERSVKFLRRVASRGPRMASPAEFPHLVPSAPSGNASIYVGLMGPVLGVSDLVTSAEAGFEVACTFVESGLATAMIAGSSEAEDPFIAGVLGPIYAGADAVPRSEGAAFVVVESGSAAAARGAKAQAAIEASVQSWKDAAGALAELPAPKGQALVVLGAFDADLESALGASRWASVERRQVVATAGQHEGIGAFALAAGAGLVARGAADEVLVASRARQRTYLTLLVAARTGP